MNKEKKQARTRCRICRGVHLIRESILEGGPLGRERVPLCIECEGLIQYHAGSPIMRTTDAPEICPFCKHKTLAPGALYDLDGEDTEFDESLARACGAIPDEQDAEEWVDEQAGRDVFLTPYHYTYEIYSCDNENCCGHVYWGDRLYWNEAKDSWSSEKPVSLSEMAERERNTAGQLSMFAES